MAKKLTVAELVEGVLAAKTTGWAVETGIGYASMDGEILTKKGWREDAEAYTSSYIVFTRTVEDLKVRIALNLLPLPRKTKHNTWEHEHAFRGMSVEGDTFFNGRCFTRRGIDCNSNALRDKPDYEHEYANVADLLDGEWKRCEDAHARSLTMVTVPGLPGGWRVTPEGKASKSADLMAGKAVTFTPHGFGVGYRVTRMKARHATALPSATSEFFGVGGPLYYTTLDCD
jgi:hypothetical protein